MRIFSSGKEAIPAACKDKTVDYSFYANKNPDVFHFLILA